MEKIEHKFVSVNGLNMHVAELGKGPLVLFIHGFPELWYSWRHQILFFAGHGYRAVAPDLRGYGDTSGAPLDEPFKFTTHHLVGDLIALLDAIAPDQGEVFVVGHDFGANIGWYMSLFRPDRVKALVNLSVPFFPRTPTTELPLKIFRATYGDDYYVCRFQEPGEVEAEFAKIDTKTLVTKFLTTFTPGTLYLQKGKGFDDKPAVLPPWLSSEDVEYYANKFEQTGFTGGLNYYRAIDKNWELTAPWVGAKIKVPAKYIVGDLDLAYHMHGVKDYIENGDFKKDVPLLEVVVIKGAAHFIHQELPNEINNHIYAFFKNF